MRVWLGQERVISMHSFLQFGLPGVEWSLVPSRQVQWCYWGHTNTKYFTSIGFYPLQMILVTFWHTQQALLAEQCCMISRHLKIETLGHFLYFFWDRDQTCFSKKLSSKYINCEGSQFSSLPKQWDFRTRFAKYTFLEYLSQFLMMHVGQ